MSSSRTFALSRRLFLLSSPLFLSACSAASSQPLLESMHSASSLNSVSALRAQPVLTYDDGPHRTLTPRILDALLQNNLRAIFFVIGQNVVRHPHIVRRALSEGHEIANHTHTHPFLTRLSSAGIERELSLTSQAIFDACGVRPTRFRPPYGDVNARVRQVARDQGLATVMWDVDTRDFLKVTSQTVSARVLAAGSGKIVLMHDIHLRTALATAAFAPQLRRR